MADVLISGVGSNNTAPASTTFTEGETSGGTSEHSTYGNIVKKAHGLSDGAVISVASGTMNTTDVTASAAELNTLDGITASTTELNYTDGVTSAIQTQLDAKVTGAASSTDNEIPRFDGTTGKLVQTSGITVADNGYVQLAGSLDTPGALVSDTISEHTAAAGITIDGVLVKDGEVTVADEAYGSGWNGSLEVPTKNALYDKIETINGGSSEPVKAALSGSTNGKAIKVTATATAGTTLHTAASGTSTTDLVSLYAQNNDADGETRTLTIEYGGTTSPDNLIIVPVPCKVGLIPIVENLPINNSLVIAGFSDEANDMQVYGHQYAQTDWLPLSGSTNGKGIKVTGTSNAADVTLHTAVTGTTQIDEVVLYAQNNDADGETRTLTIAVGAETDPDNLINVPIPCKVGLVEISSRDFPLLLNNSLVIGAWADEADDVVIYGSYRRRTL